MSKGSYPAIPEPTPVPTSSSSSITIQVDGPTSTSDEDRSRCTIYRWCPPRCHCFYRLRHPHGVSPRWIRLENFVGTLGFAAKGIVYGFIGGMTCASASRLHDNDDLNESPKGAFILIGTFPAGSSLLFILLIAFSLACAIQLQNALTKKWHYEINWEKCKTKYERWVILVTGHVGYAGRAGIFLFVGVLMFKTLNHPVQQSGDTMSDGLQQLLKTEVGTVFMMIIGIMTTFYGLYAILCCWYRHFPTPPPTGRPFVS
ncbi:hypothetical protein SpCBS45565_g06424 [Spizellomyces sp. 'palustris']|nr:hypothetical protein SpCBS45565_g06424 [Spizellomyces sp. 'palustris']